MYSAIPPRVPIVARDYDDFPPSRVPAGDKVVHIQPIQATRHNHNRKQILYLTDKHHTTNPILSPVLTVRTIQVPVSHRYLIQM